jgi:hypothetical protein
MSGEKLTLRSYSLAFELERRLHRIDRFRIPVPYGIPLVALAYAAAAMIGVALVSSLPLAGAVLGLLPWPVRLILLPGLIVRALCHRRADGRPAHEALAAYAMFFLGHKHVVGLDRAPKYDGALGTLPIAPDEQAGVYRRGVVRGPGIVLLRRPARVEMRGRVIRLDALDGAPLSHPQELELPSRARLEVVGCDHR